MGKNKLYADCILIEKDDNSMAIGNISDKSKYQKVKINIHKLSSAIERLKMNPLNYDDIIYLFVKKDRPIQIGFKEDLGIIICPIVEEK